ncbi:MAG: hypothetical protein AB7G34_07620 [Hyphomicrobiales bacterium]
MLANVERWLIGGPARCGKSALAQALWRADGPLAAMRVDALLHKYKRSGPFSSPEQASGFLHAYLERPRFMDAGKASVLRPCDDIACGAEVAAQAVAARQSLSGLELIFSAFDAMASKRGKRGWAVLDLHPEFHFRDYLAVARDMKLLVCLRDPVEAIAASLYWRHYPSRCPRAANQMRYAARLWRMSAVAACRLREKFPDRVTVVSSNAMFADARALPESFALPADAFRRLFGGDPLFHARPEKGGLVFLCPDGAWRSLLSDRELEHLEPLRRIWRGMWSGRHPAAPGGLMAAATSRWPALTKQFVDFIHDPAKGLMRGTNAIRQSVKRT